MTKCDRCHQKPDPGLTMSRFNTQMICGGCEGKEKAHPQYQAAYDAELRAVQSGDMNFPGVGKPVDL